MTWLACATAGLVFTALRQSPARAAVACGAAHANLSQNPGTSPALRMSSAVEDTFVATIGNYASEAPGRGPWDEVCSQGCSKRRKSVPNVNLNASLVRLKQT